MGVIGTSLLEYHLKKQPQSVGLPVALALHGHDLCPQVGVGCVLRAPQAVPGGAEGVAHVFVHEHIGLVAFQHIFAYFYSFFLNLCSFMQSSLEKTAHFSSYFSLPNIFLLN